MKNTLDIASNVPRVESVRQIVVAALGEPATRVSLVSEQGSVNRAYDVDTRTGSFIVRVRFDRTEVGQFLREKRCAELIRASFDWTPETIAVGTNDGHSYSVQNKVHGTVASQYQGDMSDIWEQIGGYAKFFHTIRTPGYIYDCFREPPASQDIWCKWYFDYLGEADHSKLVERGLLTSTDFDAALRALEPLRDMQFDPTLAHGNLSPSNIMVDASGKAHILDWGTCQGHLSTELDLSELLVFDTPQQHVQAYLRGHELSPAYIKENQELLERLMLARCFTSAHWLCEGESTRETSILRYTEKVRDGLRRLRG